MRAREASRLTACKSNLKNISTSVETYSNDYDGLYPGNTDFQEITPNGRNGVNTLASTYIGKTLNCPAAARPYTYRLATASGAGYWIYCPAAPNSNANNVTRRHRKDNRDGGPIFDSAIGIQERF
jgi:hypothetical protein